ncbi:MAG: hypothetical protein IJT98_03715 [Prevotella sp.]|nr:hypothetical protein [Prevotella sp.]
MRRLLRCTVLSFFLFSLFFSSVAAQEPFKGYLYNSEHSVYMRINFYEQDVVIPWQELFGPLPGFLAKDGNSYCWIVTSATISGNQAQLEMVNDYGSEDLTATLTQENDSIFTLQQTSGSPIKVAVNGKLQKVPRTLTFKRRQ